MRNMLVVLLCVIADYAVAQNHEKALEKYLTEDIVAVAYLDLSQIDMVGALEWAEKLGFGPEPEQRGQATKLMLSIQQQLDRVADFGARYVYALFRVSDISHGGPTWVIPVDAGGDPRAVRGMILSGRPDQFHVEHESRPSFFPEHCVIVEGEVLGANSEAQLQLLQSKRPTIERDLSTAWQTLGQEHCGLIVFGDQDSRRVVREMFPQLPAPFQKIEGSLISDRLLWGGVVANLPSEPSLRVIVQTDQESTATVVQQSVADGLTLLKGLPLAKQVLSVEDLDALAKLLTPGVSGSQCAIHFDDLLKDLDRIARLLTPPIQKVRQEAQRRTRMNKFKQIALGMLNYESAYGSYPPRSTYSEAGKPLLSWRVHILPYLEQGELYKQFHLDEPWDSEHNKQLIPLMPAIYADPDTDPQLRERNAVGRTTYVVPTGSGTAFEGSEGRLIKEITDGISNTIMLVELRPLAAPYWTRPKDWVLDPSNPWERLKREDRDWITTGFCDGHALILPTSTPDEKLRALVTRAGGEVIEWP